MKPDDIVYMCSINTVTRSTHMCVVSYALHCEQSSTACMFTMV